MAAAFAQQHWERLLRLRDRWRFNEETFHLILAGLVGVIGGLANLVFYLCVERVQSISLRNAGDLVDVAASLAPWQRLLMPAMGALAAGLVLHWGLRLVGQQGPNNILEVVVAGDGRLRMRSALIKALSSVLSISTGASIGREGSIVHLTAMLSSKCGQLADWQPYRLRLLVACGAAAGLSAAYNAPIAGAVFAAQIVLRNFSMNHFAPLVCASVVAAMVSRSFFGLGPWYVVPEFESPRLFHLPWFLILGILTGALGAAFLKMLRFGEDLFGRLPWPVYGRVALGGLVVGLIAVAFPEVWGNGYSVTNRLLHEEFIREQSPVWFLIGVFLAKLLATVVAVGAGTVGGVFTPTLFLGAGLGSLFGTLLHWADCAASVHVSAFALVGMGSVLAATCHSPLLAMIMIFEISLKYELMPPLMLACAVSTLVARRLHRESIYTEPLRRRGLEMEPESGEIGAATQRTVGELMRKPVSPLRETARFREMADRFLTSSNNFLPVVDEDRRLLGVVALHDLKEYLSAGQELHGVIAYDVMRPTPACLTPSQNLQEVLPIVLGSELRNIPVVNNYSEYRLVGALVRAEALGVLSETLAASSSTAS